jgi:selenium metabolism protein YedF
LTGVEVDCRGLACPQPVIRTKAAMSQCAGEIVTIVDTDTSAGNVTRMAQKTGWSVAQERRADGIYLTLRQGASGGAPATATEGVPRQMPAAGPTVLLVKSNTMGSGDDELGEVLIRAFFHTLLELAEPPATIIFVNGGVKLSVEGSPVLDDVRQLAEAGVEVLSCGTCLKFFGLTEKLRAGVISNMYTIAETLMSAGSVVSP